MTVSDRILEYGRKRNSFFVENGEPFEFSEQLAVLLVQVN
jgi:hypothetical protein